MKKNSTAKINFCAILLDGIDRNQDNGTNGKLIGLIQQQSELKIA